jgi:acyl-CoA thioesterase I
MHKLVLIAAIALFSISNAASAAQVVALGASNTEGKGRGRTPDGVPRAQAFPAQLQAVLNAQGCRVQVLNAGVAGDTTSGMLQRLPKALGKDTKVLILQPGGNDDRRGEGGSVQGNIAAIQAYAQARGVKVVMLESLGRIAAAHRLPDGQHFSAQGHAAFAAYLAPQVRAAGGCG